MLFSRFTIITSVHYFYSTFWASVRTMVKVCGYDVSVLRCPVLFYEWEGGVTTSTHVIQVDENRHKTVAASYERFNQ